MFFIFLYLGGVMKNKLFINLTLIVLCVIMCSFNAFCYKWQDLNGTWYLRYDGSNELYRNTLVEIGDSVYYFDSMGRMLTSWWKNENTGDVYFFSNKSSSLGAMVFGFSMIDGYYRYFDGNGALAHADSEGSYKKVYLDFYADYYGNMYYNGVLLRDVTEIRSIYYTDTTYYNDISMNNKTLANSLKEIKIPVPGVGVSYTTPSGKVSNTIVTNDINNAASGGLDPNVAVGGTNYYVDKYDNVIVGDTVEPLSDDEIYGPMGKFVGPEHQ